MTQQVENIVGVRIAANFTIEPIEEFLNYWLGRVGVAAEITFAPYNQVFQQLLEGGMLRSNRQGINVVAIDIDAWLVGGTPDEANAKLAKTVDDLVGVLRNAGEHGSGGVVLIFPSSDRAASTDRAEAIGEAAKRLLAECNTLRGWSALDLSLAAALYGVGETRDPFTDELGHIPFTEDMFVAAATAVARWIRCARTKARKVIVLDCDNTLWQGICGEGNVEITAPYRALQEFMLRQRDEGVLLTIASKNNEADVWAVLESELCLLKPEHFTAWQVNWQPKPENLRFLADELGLGLNSFVFVDDSPLECLEVRNATPEVLTIPLPQDRQQIPAFLEHCWAFDRPSATEEDRNRASMYQAERQRTELNRKALTREEFLASLKIEIEVAPATEADLPRVCQLTQRTTQFNMSGVQHTVQSLTGALSFEGTECLTVRVRDIFGDYGLVGAMVFKHVSDVLRVDTFLLSCRALGRGVEDRMIDDLKRRAQECGANWIAIPFVPTSRNRPALEFLSRLCEVPVNSTESFECILSATGETAGWRPSDLAPGATPEAAQSVAASPASDDGEVLIHIASDLQDVGAILAEMRSQKKHRPTDAGQFVPPKPGVEESLAKIWSDCLAVEPVGADDNFFDFGGQSLIATRILARIRTEFGVEMGLANLFERPTVRLIAAHIAELQNGGPTVASAVSTH